MTDVRERLLNASTAELYEAVEREEITADVLWDEMMASLDRSLDHLGEMAQTNRELLRFLDSSLPELSRRQDAIDRMLTEHPKRSYSREVEESSVGKMPAMKWQSIDTAPKDGKPVLLYFPGPSMRIGCWKDRGPYGTGWRDPVGHAEQATILGEPTHWMRLPDPPARRETKAMGTAHRRPAAAGVARD